MAGGQLQPIPKTPGLEETEWGLYGEREMILYIKVEAWQGFVVVVFISHYSVLHNLGWMWKCRIGVSK